MSQASPDAACRRLILNSRVPLKVRVAALSEMSRPSLAFLGRLMRDRSTPAKLLKLAIERYRVETLIRKKLKGASK